MSTGVQHRISDSALWARLCERANAETDTLDDYLTVREQYLKEYNCEFVWQNDRNHCIKFETESDYFMFLIKWSY